MGQTCQKLQSISDEMNLLEAESKKIENIFVDLENRAKSIQAKAEGIKGNSDQKAKDIQTQVDGKMTGVKTKVEDATKRLLGGGGFFKSLF